MPRLHRLTLFEHQVCAYADLPGFPSTHAERERLLDQLARLNQACAQPVLQLDRLGLRALEQVGVLQVGNLAIEILPKLDAPSPQSSESRSRAAVQNLLVMLSYTDSIQLTPRGTASLATASGSWLELLAQLLITGLYQEILSGLAHDYIPQQDRLPVLRGRWDIQRQILRHALDQPSFDVSFDERSPDIPLNQVFRAAIDRLDLLTFDARHRQLLSDLRDWFRPVQPLPDLTPEFLDSIRFHRLNERFQPAFQLARLFLSGDTLQLQHGPMPAFAFTFDMNRLFERFLAGFIDRYRSRILPEHWPGVRIQPQSVGTRLYLGKSAGQNVFRLRPDLLFQARGETSPRLIADTKYKQVDPETSGHSIAAEDVYQMLAYAVRLGCPRVLLLYPQAGRQPLRQHIDIPASGARLSACTVNLRTPLDPPDPLIAELHAIFAFAAGS